MDSGSRVALAQVGCVVRVHDGLRAGRAPEAVRDALLALHAVGVAGAHEAFASRRRLPRRRTRAAPSSTPVDRPSTSRTRRRARRASFGTCPSRTRCPACGTTNPRCRSLRSRRVCLPPAGAAVAVCESAAAREEPLLTADVVRLAIDALVAARHAVERRLQRELDRVAVLPLRLEVADLADRCVVHRRQARPLAAVRAAGLEARSATRIATLEAVQVGYGRWHPGSGADSLTAGPFGGARSERRARRGRRFGQRECGQRRRRRRRASLGCAAGGERCGGARSEERRCGDQHDGAWRARRAACRPPIAHGRRAYTAARTASATGKRASTT
jgi:hypothetical protein